MVHTSWVADVFQETTMSQHHPPRAHNPYCHSEILQICS